MSVTGASCLGRASAENPYPISRRRLFLSVGLVGLLGLLVVVAVLSVGVGARSVAPDTVFSALWHYQPADSDHQVIISRIPRLVAGLLVGAALGLAGAIMQAVTRNPLADPGLLGVNAGAALAIVCAIGVLGIESASGYVWFGFVGATVVAVLVYAIGSLGRDGATPVKLALAGAAIGAMLTSATTAVLLTDAATFDRFRFWTVGSLTGRRLDLVLQVAPFIVVGALLALCLGRALNTLSLGDDVARGLGQRVGLARGAAAAAAVILCGAATAIAGPIWFAGLLVPHLARIVTGPDQRWILAYSMLLAPLLLIASDVVGRVIARPGEVQVGIMLAFIGAPLLILLIRRRKLVEA